MAGYLGNVPVPQATQTRDRFVATSGQTTFATSGYTVGYLDVYLNGVKLDSTDYTATNGSDVVLSVGATVDDVVDVIAFSTFVASDAVSASSGGRFGGSVTVSGTVDATTFTQGGQPLEAGAKEGIFWENSQTITSNYTITSGKNAGTFGPVTIADGVTVTIPDGSTWTVV